MRQVYTPLPSPPLPQLLIGGSSGVAYSKALLFREQRPSNAIIQDSCQRAQNQQLVDHQESPLNLAKTGMTENR